jgi:hypothetical protein
MLISMAAFYRQLTRWRESGAAEGASPRNPHAQALGVGYAATPINMADFAST